MAAASPDTPEFYMRPLKPPCVSFLDPSSKARLVRALTAGTGEAYLPLSSQFRTQDDPAFCGISSLVMSLNALQIDPGRRWKGDSVWRWFEESMLSCCEPLDKVRTHGISLDSLACLARCQGAGAVVLRPPALPNPAGGPETEPAASAAALPPPSGALDSVLARPTTPLGLATFRGLVVSACSTASVVLVVAFDRRALSQTGGGHFSPVAAYDAATDSALVLDVARFKLPPFWVPVPSLYESLRGLDSATGRPRGVLLLRRLASAPVLFATVEDLVLGAAGRSERGASPSEAAAGSCCGGASAHIEAERLEAPGAGAACLAGALLRSVHALIAEAATPADAVGEAGEPGGGSSGAGLPVRLARAFATRAGPQRVDERCVRRVSGAQVSDARALLEEMRSWPPHREVREATGEGRPGGSSAADAAATGSEDDGGAGEGTSGAGAGARACRTHGGSACVSVGRSHIVTLLLASLAVAARRVGEADAPASVPCPSCAEARSLGLADPRGSRPLTAPALAAFAVVPLPPAGGVLLREATLLSEQVLAVAGAAE